MLEVADALAQLGLRCTGKALGIHEVSQKDCPLIAHLRDPDHFLIVLGLDENFVKVLDVHDQRADVRREKIARRWSGHVLLVGSRDLDAAQTSAPRAALDSLHSDTGTLARGANIGQCRYTIRNTGGAPLTIQSVVPSCGCTAARIPSTPIMPGASSEIVLEIDVRGMTGDAFFETALVVSNDPVNAYIAITASGTIDLPAVRVLQRRVELAIHPDHRSAEVRVPIEWPRGGKQIELLGTSWAAPSPLAIGETVISEDPRQRNWWPRTTPVVCSVCSGSNPQSADLIIQLTANEVSEQPVLSTLLVAIALDGRRYEVPIQVAASYGE